MTLLLRKWSGGDQAAAAELAPLIYNELRHMAHRYLRRERPDHSWRSADLVHEAYLRLVDHRKAEWQDRAHFFGVAAQLMRRMLIDHARAHHREKRGGGQVTVAFLDSMDMPAQRSMELIALDDALDGLAKLDPQQSRIVELRFFAGLSVDEVAEVLGVSNTTVGRHWVTARVWLARELARK